MYADSFEIRFMASASLQTLLCSHHVLCDGAEGQGLKPVHSQIAVYWTSLRQSVTSQFHKQYAHSIVMKLLILECLWQGRGEP